MSQENSAIFLVTQLNTQTQLFIDHIYERMHCPVYTPEPDAPPEEFGGDKALVLLDSDYVDKHGMYRWHEQAAQRLSMTLAAFNLRDEEHAMGILSSLNLQGVFYRHDNLAMIYKGIGALLQDRFWLSRSLMIRLIGSYRRQQLNTYRPVCGLTHRELEILSLLGSGDSNLNIANKLLVSEHTVRSHLYNIFRKIRVRNRFQAMNWARQNLSASSVLPLDSSSKTRKP